MIHMAGFNQAPAFNTDYLLGPAWFISSLLLALIPFRFLLSSPFSLVRRQAGKRIFSGICSVLRTEQIPRGVPVPPANPPGEERSPGKGNPFPES